MKHEEPTGLAYYKIGNNLIAYYKYDQGDENYANRSKIAEM